MRAHPDSEYLLAVTFSKDGLIASLSSTAERLTEYEAQDLVGRPITHIMADRSIFQMTHMMDSALRRGCWEGEIAHRSRSGKCFNARCTLRPLAGGGETVWGYLLLSTAASPQSCEDSRIREVASNLRVISHELNNPLAVIMGFAQLIMLNTRCEGQLRSDMEKVYAELKRVIQVVEELHSYAVTLQDDKRASLPTIAKEA
jgi:PAS domain S-box-containing protein